MSEKICVSGTNEMDVPVVSVGVVLWSGAWGTPHLYCWTQM
jgi:hypothetical protein